MRIRLVPIVLVLALGSSAIAVAKPSFPARVSIDFDFEDMPFAYVFSGKVRSEKQGCVTDRKVLLFNESLEDPIGSDRAKRSGAYEIRLGADGLLGDYYTKVRRLERSGYVCKGDESRRIEAG